MSDDGSGFHDMILRRPRRRDLVGGYLVEVVVSTQEGEGVHTSAKEHTFFIGARDELQYWLARMFVNRGWIIDLATGEVRCEERTQRPDDDLPLFGGPK